VRGSAGRLSLRFGRLAWLVFVLAFLAASTEVQAPPPPASMRAAMPVPAPIPEAQPITPIPEPPAADPRKLALGDALFHDPRLSGDGRRTCASCHDIRTNGADANVRDRSPAGVPLRFNTPTVFNAALSFRLGWTGKYRTLAAQAEASLVSPNFMGASFPGILGRLDADPRTVRRFERAYGHRPDQASLLDAIATYEASLLTPGSRFDRWLEGDRSALSPEELHGYQLFKSFGCISCHQGVNVGGNLFERYGIFHKLTAPGPKLLRVPSLRNIATTAPYFQNGSAPTLKVAVRRMARAQLDRMLAQPQLDAIIAFLKTLTGKYRGVPVVAPPR
jgi:cytochrome c peroxidase